MDIAVAYADISLLYAIILSVIGERQGTEQQRSDGPRCGYRRGYEEGITRATGSFETTAIATARPIQLMQLMLQVGALWMSLLLKVRLDWKRKMPYDYGRGT
jgi:hypothetical protein